MLIVLMATKKIWEWRRLWLRLFDCTCTEQYCTLDLRAPSGGSWTKASDQRHACVLWNWKASVKWIAFDWAALQYTLIRMITKTGLNNWSCDAAVETSALIIFSLRNALRGERCLSNLQNIMHFIFTIKIIVFTTVCMKWHTFVTVNCITRY